MRWLASIVAVLALAPAGMARTGTLRTTSGDVFVGNVRITPERAIVVNQGRNLVVATPLAGIAELMFETNAPRRSAEETAAGPLPAGWRETDIGMQRRLGGTRHHAGTFAVRGGGLNIDAEADSFHYVYRAVQGDAEIVARVSSIQYTHPNAKAGLMMRDTMSEYSRNVMVAVTAQRAGAFQCRYAEGRTTQSIAKPDLRPSQWLKLRRRGDEFYSYKSGNGRQWTLVEKTQLSMGESIYVGLAVASARPDMLNWTTFDKVRQARKLMNDDFTPQVELVSGSVVTGRPTAADEERLQFAGTPKLFEVGTPGIARIIYQPLPGDIAGKARASRAGVWVSSDDFFDGEFRHLEGDTLRVSSVLYGLRTFDVNDEVLAVVLRSRKLPAAAFEVQMLDGSLLLASTLALGDGEFHISEPALGRLNLPAYQVAGIRRR